MTVSDKFLWQSSSGCGVSWWVVEVKATAGHLVGIQAFKNIRLDYP